MPDDAQFAGELFDKYRDRLVRLAEQHLNRQARRKEDPEDLVQSAFKSLLRRHAAGKLSRQDGETFWSLLVIITLRKCSKRMRDYHRGRRDISREADSEDPAQHAISQEPTPEHAAVLIETVGLLLEGLEEQDKTIIVRRLEGFTESEISQEVRLSERTVRRVVKRAKDRLGELVEPNATD